MKRTTINLNGKEVAVTHQVKTDKVHQTVIHLTATLETVSLNHTMTIGAVDQPLPENYDSAALQKDLDAARNKLAALVESKHRAKLLASAVV
jgi:hypothetical protein